MGAEPPRTIVSESKGDAPGVLLSEYGSHEAATGSKVQLQPQHEYRITRMFPVYEMADQCFHTCMLLRLAEYAGVLRTECALRKHPKAVEHNLEDFIEAECFHGAFS